MVGWKDAGAFMGCYVARRVPRGNRFGDRSSTGAGRPILASHDQRFLVGGLAPNLAALAHELRTPLAAIAGLADALGAKALGPLSDTYAEYGRLIRETALHAITVVDAMAEAAPRPDDALACLSKVARDVVDALGPRAGQQGVRLAIEDHLQSPLRLPARPAGQILFNLLDNALKATALEARLRSSWTRTKDWF